jgi:hypothetical protein
MKIEALCAAPPEVPTHSPSQIPLSCPVAQPGHPELIELQASLATAPLLIVRAATKRRYRRCCPLLWRGCCHRNDVRCCCDDAVSWQQHNCPLSAPRRSAGTASASAALVSALCVQFVFRFEVPCDGPPPLPHIVSANPGTCSEPSVRKVATIPAATGLLCLAGQPRDSVMRLNGQSKEKLRAISNFKDGGVRIRQPAGEKAASPSDLEDFKRILKTQLLINLNDTKGAPRCTKQVKKTIGTATWSRLCILFAAPGASGVVKELHAKGEAAFMAEVGAKAQMWWNQSGNSEASKIKVAWAEDKKKKKMRGASSSDAEEPEAKRQTGASSSPASAPCAAVPTAGGASMRF